MKFFTQLLPILAFLLFFSIINNGCPAPVPGSGGVTVTLTQSATTDAVSVRIAVMNGTQEVEATTVTGVGVGTEKGATFSVPNGTYAVRAYVDSNGDGDADEGEYYDQSSNVVVSGSNVSAELFLNQIKSHWGFYEISGVVTASSNYNTYVGLYTEDFLSNPGASLRGTAIVQKKLDANYKFRLKAGTYYVGAYVDSNENGVQDDTDRLGVFGWNSSTEEAVAEPITVASDVSLKRFAAYIRLGNIAFIVTFNVEMVDDAGSSLGADQSATTGLATSLKLDGNGNPHIVHWYGYATKTGDTWSSEGPTSSYGSLALDANGSAHISHYTSLTEDLLYSTNATGAWKTTPIDTEGTVGIDTSIALDALGNVHISYTDFGNHDLNYITNQSGEWVAYPIDTEGSVGRYTSIAVDSNNQVHISYYDSTNGNLKHAMGTAGGQWLVTAVDTSEDVGMFASLALDSTNNVHISYYDRTNENLKYATNKSGNWVAENVEASEDDVGSYSSIAVDSSGKVHISYRNATSNRPKYATNKTGSWVTHWVGWGGLGQEGTDTSIAVDANGKVHISYFDVVDKEVKYAKSN